MNQKPESNRTYVDVLTSEETRWYLRRDGHLVSANPSGRDDVTFVGASTGFLLVEIVEVENKEDAPRKILRKVCDGIRCIGERTLVGERLGEGPRMEVVS